MKWFQRVFALSLAVAILGGCGSVSRAASPEAVVVAAGRQTLQQLDIVGVRHQGNQAVVLYTAIDPGLNNAQPMPVFGYQYLRRTWLGWEPMGGGSSGSSVVPVPGQLIHSGLGTSSDGREQVTIVFGRALDPRVVAVEAVFANGRTARDSVTDGVFALLIEGSDEICELRALDAQDQVLPGPHPAPGPGGCGRPAPGAGAQSSFGIAGARPRIGATG